jgi:hypothetical protein
MASRRFASAEVMQRERGTEAPRPHLRPIARLGFVAF